MSKTLTDSKQKFSSFIVKLFGCLGPSEDLFAIHIYLTKIFFSFLKTFDEYIYSCTEKYAIFPNHLDCSVKRFEGIIKKKQPRRASLINTTFIMHTSLTSNSKTLLTKNKN